MALKPIIIMYLYTENAHYCPLQIYKPIQCKTDTHMVVLLTVVFSYAIHCNLVITLLVREQFGL